ncbi:DEAD/DEAH box helicase [Raoultibacter phocaeensis]|uniref:DEAD/DEAH box helicase n=1 Tax=Raoultibacter phocaeensis TaxID=2479841 RepID=UPI00111BAF63|nr:DEAD/DEAH box helicase [Raoultibacter phocaeensis]
MSDAFGRLAPFIQDYIYANEWTELRAVQVAACDVIFDTECNLLLSSGTASGKTEAAFLPVLTDLAKHPSSSVGILYISPLKALINDQFKRLEQILVEGNIPVCKWHGDASISKKNALVKKPEGVLQITPESLESLLMNKRGASIKMFSDLRYVIIDEVHHFMRDSRGIQVLSLLERMQRLTGNVPRRIGLSATLGDIGLAERWLNTGSGRECISPVTDDKSGSIRLFVHRFVKAQDDDATHADSGDRAHFEYLFKMTLDKKTIIFANSREEIEFIMANLREIALANKAPDVYRVHHGNVSAQLREQAEDEMKVSEDRIVTGATVTLELGIDIGSLDQAVQIGAPATVSSFAQRLGRCGRRGQVPQLLFTFVEDVQATAADKLGPINWSFIRLIAIIQLYTKHRWIEPIPPQKHPYSLVYHQTMSTLKSNGELSAAKLAQEVLSLGSFKSISQDDFKLLLNHLIATEHIQKTEQGGLIIGRVGEKIVNHFHFYTVFIVPEYYLVKDENKPIGTVDKIYPVGVRFSLAGITWETLDVNEKSKVLFVKRVPGISVVDWNVDFESELHTVLVRTMRSILRGNESYPYLSDSCKERLAEIRYLALGSTITENLVTQLSEHTFAVFPWVGTRQLFTLHFCLLGRGIKSKMPWRTAVYLEVCFGGTAEELEREIADILASKPNLHELPLPDDIEIAAKYNEYVPYPLLRKQFVEDFLDFDGLVEGLE